MGRRGPPKTPSALNELRGNPGKRAVNRREPKPQRPKSGSLIVPKWMDGKAKWAFKELCKILDDIKVLTVADRKALELLCDAYAEYRGARQFVMEHGMTYDSETRDGGIMVRKYPQVEIAANAWKRCSDMLKQFGLTPSSRTGIERIEDPEADPFDEFLNQQKSGKVVRPPFGKKK